MPRNNFSNERKKSATNLRSLAGILNKSRVCSDTSPLRSAAEQCCECPPLGDKSWGYDIADLTFHFDPPKGIVPANAQDFRIGLSISMVCHFDRDKDDQFSKLEINVEKYALDPEGVQFKSAWHLDRHLINTKSDSPHITDDIHPLYHFQFGGSRMTNNAFQLGQTLLLDPPRLMHPPMDGILAIDFVLANYAGLVWKSLRDDHEYTNLIVPQIERFWKPYFEAMANIWESPNSTNSAYLCPFVMN